MAPPYLFLLDKAWREIRRNYREIGSVGIQSTTARIRNGQFVPRGDPQVKGKALDDILVSWIFGGN
jgi:hypothetical protein